MFRRPRSMPLIYVLSSPHSAARSSCESPFAFLSSKTRRPNLIWISPDLRISIC